MPSFAGTQEITRSDPFRIGVNDSGADIPKCRIAQYGANVGSIALCTGPTGKLAGVTTVAIANGKFDSFQRAGVNKIESGAAYAIHVPLTSDAAGRAVAATVVAGAYSIIGFSLEAATAAGQFKPVEITPTMTSVG